TAIDTTGAGDVFAAAIVLGTLAGWPLEERLKFSSLCSALAGQQFGGSLAAPGWGGMMDWWHSLSSAADGGDLRAAFTRGGSRFLAESVPDHPVQGRRRAQGTFALGSDAGRHWAAPTGRQSDPVPGDGAGQAPRRGGAGPATGRADPFPRYRPAADEIGGMGRCVGTRRALGAGQGSVAGRAAPFFRYGPAAGGIGGMGRCVGAWRAS